jgi:hypothetical protein
MRKLCVLCWRPWKREALYFRGDDRYEIYLPYISEKLVERGQAKGWVEDVNYARVFETPILLEERSFAKQFIKEQFFIAPYEYAILPGQIFRPIRRPPNRFAFIKEPT